MLIKLRRKIAGFILGDDTVFFINKKDNQLLKDLRYTDVPDDVVGKMFKHFTVIAGNFIDNDPKYKDRTFREAMISSSVLYLATEANRMNAASADFTVSGSLDGGKTEGQWAVRIEACPDKIMSDTRRIEIVSDPSDHSKTISMSVTFGNPGYDEWKAWNKAKFDDAIAG